MSRIFRLRAALRSTLAGALLLVIAVIPARAQTPDAGAGAVPTRVLVDTLRWSGTPGGIQLANLQGDPMIPDRPYSVVLKIPDGKWIPPHWHPREQHLSVLSGTLRLGAGASLDSAHAQLMRPGEVGLIPAEARHFEGGMGTTTVLIYGIGPMTTFFTSPPK